MRQLHPLRLQYELFSDANPMMAPIAGLAKQVRAKRRPTGADNPFTAMQENVSRQIVAALDGWREVIKSAAERLFMATYGSTALQAAAGIDPHSALPLRKAAKSALHQKLIELVSPNSNRVWQPAACARRLFARFSLPAWIGLRSTSAASRWCAAFAKAKPTHLCPYSRRPYASNSTCVIDSEAALAAIPSMLPDDADTRRKAFDLIGDVLDARGRHSARDRERIERIGRLFGVERRLSARGHPAIASDIGNEPQTRA